MHKMTNGAIIIEGHVQGLSNTRSLGQVGIPVIVIDKHKSVASYSRYCKSFFKCPSFELDEFADFLINLAVQENLNGWVLIPSNDHAVFTISRNKINLEKHFRVITPEINIINNIYNKSRLLSIAQEVNIPIPKTYYPSEDFWTGVGLTFPVLTKGRQGLDFYKATGKKAFLANDHKELQNQLEIINRVFNVANTFIQELIPFDGTNKTISFTAFCVNGEIKAYWMGVKLREHPLRFGTATFAQSVYVEKCYKQSVPLLKALNYTGVCEVEYLFDPRDSQYKLIEINARTWLWVGLAKACGVDFAKMIYDFANDNETYYPSTYEVGVKWYNPVSDTLFAFAAMLKGYLKPGQHLRSIMSGKNVNALFVKGDLKPGFAYFFNLLSFLKHR